MEAGHSRFALPSKFVTMLVSSIRQKQHMQHLLLTLRVERMRSTLLHEMCHAAVHLIDGLSHAASHGREFKYWYVHSLPKRNPDMRG